MQGLFMKIVHLPFHILKEKIGLYGRITFLRKKIFRKLKVYQENITGTGFRNYKDRLTEQSQINVVLNWFEELKRLVPTN